MNKQNNDPNFRMADNEVKRQIDDLYTKLHDNLISDDECGLLKRLLINLPLARHRYLLNTLLNCLLADWSGKRGRVEAEQLGAYVDTNEATSAFYLASEQRQAGNEVIKIAPASRFSFPTWAIAASCIGLLLVSALALSTKLQNQSVANRNDNLQQIQEAESAPDAKAVETKSSGLARENVTISFISDTAQLKNLEPYPKVGQPLSTGQLLEIEEGAIEICYASGTKILLIAPADFVVQKEGGQLITGGLVASVPEKGHGFTITTPRGRVVDFGTEFGVAVDDFGVSKVSVFDGKVEAFPVSSSPNREEKVELVEGESLQWSEHQRSHRGTDSRNFAPAILGRDLELRRNGFSRLDQFRDTIDSKTWTAIGTIETSKQGIIMTASPHADERPYLISTEQFDPLKGPVSVTCDFRFSDFGDDVAPALSLMTRSASQRGTAEEPWNGILASCVCCSYGGVSPTREGSLQTSVKLGSENPMSSISWSGNLPPQPNTHYRMVMRDDGVNVSLTVSLVDDPEVTQTVVCRSLFQGQGNHIALGGLLTGAAVIDRLEIVQDLPESSVPKYDELRSLMEVNPAQRSIERKLIENFSPANATLIQEDAFSDSQLNIEKWQTLGDVFVENSEVHLGIPNEEGLIDTWKSRPYLLTSERFDPSRGALTVVGTISFAENFRSGYGATFSVMTRANTERGDGNGWENSILQLGVRTTFWPASADDQHTLEIHEKPAANTITLLEKQAVEVDPFSRRYVFRVVDDGDVVSMTVVDPKSPSRKMEVRSKTQTTLRSGCVGFESCWGSPIKLDNVRIYQADDTGANAD